jgi:ArsR family transcriptional regulator
MFGLAELLHDEQIGSAPGRDEEALGYAARIFSALAHPTRLKIVELLSVDERGVVEIAAELSMLQPNVSQHLAILQRAGLVTATKRGVRRLYATRGSHTLRMLELLDEARRCDRNATETM